MRAGGHSVAGMWLNDGGIVIDVRPMKRSRWTPTPAQVRVGAGVDVGRVRPRHPGARAGHHRRPGVDDRRAGPHPRRRVGLAGAQVGAQLRQPHLRRPRHRRRPRGHRERVREPRAVLGAARRRRQLRRRRRRSCSASTRSARSSPPGSCCGRATPRTTSPAVPRPRATTRPTSSAPASCFLTGPPEEFVPAHLQGTTSSRVAGAVGRRRRRGRRGGRAVPRAVAGGRPRGADAVRRLPVHDRRPAGLPQLLVGRLPRRRSPTRRSTCS